MLRCAERGRCIADFMAAPLIFAASTAANIPLWLITPFALLLLLIAVLPLSGDRAKHVWEHYYPHISVTLGTAVAVYYLARIPQGERILLHTLHEYVSFILLIGSLFVVAGGIHLKVKGESTPWVNVVFLAVGAVIANIIGTTGASMVLIRPWIRMNKIRIAPFHVVFFIFIVSNVGGALTPIGDPPLFLGYLRGVPFFWLFEHVLAEWLFTVGALLAVFFVLDRQSFRKMPARLQQEAAAESEQWRFDGKINLLFLAALIGAVFLPAEYFLREGAMLAIAIASYRLTAPQVHAENAFTFGPIKEVGFLFVGIFVTMMPALGYLERHGVEFGFTHPLQYYFASGSLSAVLDNAPTYVNFLQLAQSTAEAENPAAFAGLVGLEPVRTLLQLKPQLVVAVSLGAVFFGAMTYIGNGPNFMVKSIAHDAGVHCPTFFGYVLRYSLPILLPILVVAGVAFLR
jgi:Na+/H+ antiporter NhaD/arsenite permease-like protein